jgi:hypothetical protein
MSPLLLPAWSALPENRAANFGLRASGMLTAVSAGSQPGRPTGRKRFSAQVTLAEIIEELPRL